MSRRHWRRPGPPCAGTRRSTGPSWCCCPSSVGSGVGGRVLRRLALGRRPGGVRSPDLTSARAARRARRRDGRSQWWPSLQRGISLVRRAGGHACAASFFCPMSPVAGDALVRPGRSRFPHVPRGCADVRTQHLPELWYTETYGPTPRAGCTRSCRRGHTEAATRHSAIGGCGGRRALWRVQCVVQPGGSVGGVRGEGDHRPRWAGTGPHHTRIAVRDDRHRSGRAGRGA